MHDVVLHSGIKTMAKFCAYHPAAVSIILFSVKFSLTLTINNCIRRDAAFMLMYILNVTTCVKH